jgi:ribonucleoside-diphosphate reductase alpha chain
MAIMVKKRDGSFAPLDITKIQKNTKAAVQGLEGVSQSELEVDTKIKFIDGIKTEEIQKILINTAIDKIDVDRPNWTFVAARLFLFDAYHKVGKALNGKKGIAYPHLKKYLQNGVYENKITPIILSNKFYDDEAIEELNNYIDGKRDLQFNYIAIKTFFDRYIIKNKEGNPIELPQLLFMGLSMFLAVSENKNSIPKDKIKNPERADIEARVYWAKKFYDLLSKFEVMLATPTLSNGRTLHGQLSSCYVNRVPDNIEGIMRSYRDFALLSKFGGGVGTSWKITAQGGEIRGVKGAAGGIVPFLKVSNDLCLAVDQLGVRKGSNAVYTPIYNMDIPYFIELKKNSGEERRRTHDLFPAISINEKHFFEQVKNNKNINLFDYKNIPEFDDLYGDDFIKAYNELSLRDDIRKTSVDAKGLWKEILRNYFETGSPFLFYKDESNRRHQLKDVGTVYSSNLCMEIMQYTKAPKLKTIITYLKDGEEVKKEFLEDERVLVNDEIGYPVRKKADKLTTTDFYEGSRILYVEHQPYDDEIAVCNLGSINLSKIHTEEDIKRVTKVLVRMLDNVIDLNYYPVEAARIHNQKTRGIGLGVMGEAHLLAKKQIMYGSKEHLEYIDELYENISYYTYEASIELAKEKGRFPLYDKSEYAKGIMPVDTINENILKVSNVRKKDWNGLKKKMQEYGLRNGYLMAIPPTSSISIIVGTTPSIEPVFKRKWIESNLSGEIPVTAPDISADTWQYYVSAYDVDKKSVVYAAAIRQKWIDQGQSLNIYMKLDEVSGKLLNEIYTLGAEIGIKSFYYLRSQSPEQLQEEVREGEVGCLGCE